CDFCDKGCCKNSSEEAAAPPAKKLAEAVRKSPQELRNEKMAAKLMEKYHKAIADGDLEKARKYGRQALDLDPACFTKPVETKVGKSVPMGDARFLSQYFFTTPCPGPAALNALGVLSKEPVSPSAAKPTHAAIFRVMPAPPVP